MIPAESGRFQVIHTIPGSEPKVRDVLAWGADGKPMVFGDHGLTTFTGSATGSWKVTDLGPAPDHADAVLARVLLLRLFGTLIQLTPDGVAVPRPEAPTHVRLTTDELNMLLDQADCPGRPRPS